MDDMLKTLLISVCLGAAAGVLVVANSPAQTRRVVLITTDEAKRPPVAPLTFRAGVSRGPEIQLLSPKPSEKSVVSPVHLQLKFAGHGGAQIDENSFRLLDVADPAVDLTDRVKEFAKPTGIDVPEAEIPPGTYTIRAEIKDDDGRVGVLTFNLNVVKQ
ncbi:MAG TPA: hypothetical protein VEK75_01655 [Xanthobacteraceae bacterium]|nr:hypothetical protein [Xanthobacteraceae bacterium]